jgi:hypothetical protein
MIFSNIKTLKYFKNVFFVVLLFSFGTMNGQVISKKRGEIRSVGLIKEGRNDIILLFCEDYYVKYSVTENLIKDSIPYIIEDSSFKISNIITDFEQVSIKENVYFLENTGGGVIKFVNGRFTRLDKSYSHRLTFGSTKFQYNNLLYQYGGYGFFSTRDFFTFFDPEINEWEVLSPVFGENAPIGTSSSTGIIFKDKLFVFNGYSVNKFDKKKFDPFNELWSFDLKNKKWEKIGQIEAENLTRNAIVFDSTALIFDKRGDIHFINVFENKVYKYKRSLLIEKLSENFSPIYLNGNLYCITKDINNNLEELKVIALDKIKGDLIAETIFYKKTNSNLITAIFVSIALLALVSFILLLIFGRIRKSKNIRIENNAVYFKKIKLELDPIDFEIIELLLENPEGIDGGEILNITEKKGLNYSHNIRQRNVIIKNINLYFKAKVNIDYDVIISNKSSYDQRMRTFILIN